MNSPEEKKENIFNPLKYPLCFNKPRRLTDFSSWHEHIPFAMFIVEILKPNVIVELGTYYGDSYCSFCQAVKDLGLDTHCYAVDTWKGDPQTGFYGPEVLEDLRNHHDSLYGSFSRLIQSTFDEALEHFSDGTIDLLHIDGYHAYEIVKHDFEAWLPKMSQSGVILLHDINVREDDFGVWRLWHELKTQFPYFEFLHGHGLGILGVGKDQSKISWLYRLQEEEILKVQNFFFELGYRLTLKHALTQKERLLSNLNNTLKQRDYKILEMANVLSERNRVIQDLNENLRLKENEIKDQEGRVERLERGIKEREISIEGLKSELFLKDSQIKEREAHLVKLESEIKEREISIEGLKSELFLKD
ncbi:MAG: class I SAM-dependent methyltransferase, partial [Bacteroidales bacterium]